MPSSFWLLGVESRDFSYEEKESFRGSPESGKFFCSFFWKIEGKKYCFWNFPTFIGCHQDVGHPDSILICDGCDMGWHMDCIKPSLKTIPEGDFYFIIHSCSLDPTGYNYKNTNPNCQNFWSIWMTFKVQLFWEGHKNLCNLPLYGFDIY